MTKIASLIGIISITLTAACTQMGDRGQTRQSVNFSTFQAEVILPYDAEIQTDSASKPDENGSLNIIAFSERSPVENLDFYLKALPSRGWALTSQKYADAISLQFVKGNQLMSIHITYRGEGLENKSLIRIVSER